ncbi:hypothetical protein NIES4106_53720 (plasmid) [Fischerella sp. NIES-4106]|nr:hypothetical protein NIES4106_53720 [Fischerella sp. NIES-4106]
MCSLEFSPQYNYGSEVFYMNNNRKLAPLEQAMEIMHRHAGPSVIIVASRIKGSLKEEIVRQALDLLQCHHPRLNSRIVDSSDSLRFETEATLKIPLRVVNKFHNEQWQEVFEEEMNEKFDSSQYLLRTTLVQIENENSTTYLLTTIHHAIADALSSIQLHSQILTYCKNLTSKEEVTKVASLPELPPVEELVPKSMKGFTGAIHSVLFLLREVFQKFWYRPKNLGFEQYVPIELWRGSMIHKQLDPQLTQQLVNLCRKEGTTVHGALCAAMLFAAAKKMTAGNRSDVRVNCISPIDLRKRLQPVVGNEHLSTLVGGVTSFHILRVHTSFWELARDVKQQLEAGIKRNDIFSDGLMFRNIVEFFLSSQSNEVCATVLLTNIGRVNIPKAYDPFILEEISFAPAARGLCGVFSAAVASFEDKMLLNFLFSEPSISRDTMESLVDSVMSCLVKVCVWQSREQLYSPLDTE